MISNNKKRVLITIPKDKLEKFQKQAVEEDLTLSQFLVRSANTTIARMKPDTHLDGFAKK